MWLDTQQEIWDLSLIEIFLCQLLCAHREREIGRCYSVLFHVLFSLLLSGVSLSVCSTLAFFFHHLPSTPFLFPPGSLVVFIRALVLFVCLWRLHPLIRSRSNPVV